MNKTKIEWCDYTVNPVKGYCPMACEYCYARAMYDRFHWDKTIRSDLSVFDKLPRKPSRIFVGSTIELFGDWVSKVCIETILWVVQQNPQHTFIFLTKKPENLSKWNPWPENAWVGVTATDNDSWFRAWQEFPKIEAAVKFVSFEPLLSHISIGSIFLEYSGIDWIIVGQQTGRGAVKADVGYIQEIINAADGAGIPIFLKDNLGWANPRQKFPKVDNQGKEVK